MKNKTLKRHSFMQGAFIATFGVVICKIIGMLYVIPFYSIIGDQGGALYGYAYSIYSIFLGVSTAGIPLAMSKLISEYATLGYQETKQRMKDENLNKLINDYMSNIDDSKDKTQDFIKLKDNLKTFIDDEDILSKMQIEERLAQCFYYTIKDFSIEEVKMMLNHIEEDFYEAISLVGEEILNEREDNIEITSYYNRIKELKPQLNRYDYLVYICAILLNSKILKLKYSETKNNSLSRNNKN